jgi:lipoprotein-anchoring transpeptidase ErfK/SrfK
MTNILNLKTVAAIATVVAATVISTQASANPFDFLNTNRQPSQATAYANPNEDTSELRADLRRQVVNYPSNEAPGTIIVDTPHTYLYFVMGGGKAMRYGIGVGREGFTWSGVKTVERKAEWPIGHRRRK